MCVACSQNMMNIIDLVTSKKPFALGSFLKVQSICGMTIIYLMGSEGIQIICHTTDSEDLYDTKSSRYMEHVAQVA